ncbi:hypothetical protein Vretimale_19178 [Volvox reticuliferus]|uniref:HMA domain-containing protein n=1 Tax=Volvox reticuliferus TaxID=1737510 RepID=A0A8J4D578_9CHLO|nr:hypothetical protein Vretifemale_20332 [Volvox reticuliferus]GIM16556.1 hypothetical protein Vretimale_19178 [Volvox reticuliferus]
MTPITQRQSASRGLVAVHVATNSTRRCRFMVLPLAAANLGNSSDPKLHAHHAAWGWQLLRATVVATTAQFCVAASQAANASVGGGFGAGGGYGGFGGGGGGGGDGPSSTRPVSSANVLGDAAEASDFVEEVVLLDVGGMKCGGCVGHVKKILEAQPGVTSASVNLTTETALVRVLVPRGGGGGGGRGGSIGGICGDGSDGGGKATTGRALAALGEDLAKALSNAGFESRVRVDLR